MEEANLSQLSEAEIISMYSNIIESGQEILIAKSCPYGYELNRTFDNCIECFCTSCSRNPDRYAYVCPNYTMFE